MALAIGLVVFVAVAGAFPSPALFSLTVEFGQRSISPAVPAQLLCQLLTV